MKGVGEEEVAAPRYPGRVMMIEPLGYLCVVELFVTDRIVLDFAVKPLGSVGSG